MGDRRLLRHCRCNDAGKRRVDGQQGRQLALTAYGYESYGNAPFTSVGRQNIVENDNGTITRSVYDENNDVLQTWVGTDDSSASDSDPSGTYALTGIRDPNNNMVEVSRFRLRRRPEPYPSDCLPITGGASLGRQTPTSRVTQMFYDWRTVKWPRRKACWTTPPTKSDGVQRPITYNVMDNLGEITATYVFSGSGVSVSSIADYTTDATPDPSSLLRSYSARCPTALATLPNRRLQCRSSERCHRQRSRDDEL